MQQAVPGAADPAADPAADDPPADLAVVPTVDLAVDVTNREPSLHLPCHNVQVYFRSVRGAVGD